MKHLPLANLPRARLSPDATYRHDWQGLEALALLLKHRAAPPHYLSCVDPHLGLRVAELLKLHDLCVCVLAGMQIEEREMQLKAHQELLGIAAELHRVSAHLRKGSHEIMTLANQLAQVQTQMDSGSPATRHVQSS